MIVLLSPTKQMDFSRPFKFPESHRNPLFYNEALMLNECLKSMKIEEVQKLMKISDKLSSQTYENIFQFENPERDSQPALFAYSGTVFQSLDPRNLNYEDLLFARKQIRILSGMYGILKVDDLVSPYRLEMKTALANSDGDNLYSFWKKRITDSLKEESSMIINLASLEYFKAVDVNRLDKPVISFYFKEKRGTKVRTVGMYSKVARGLMARKIVEERIEDPALLQTGDIGGYCYNSELSNEKEWVFIREE